MNRPPLISATLFCVLSGVISFVTWELSSQQYYVRVALDMLGQCHEERVASSHDETRSPVVIPNAPLFDPDVERCLAVIFTYASVRDIERIAVTSRFRGQYGHAENRIYEDGMWLCLHELVERGDPRSLTALDSLRQTLQLHEGDLTGFDELMLSTPLHRTE